MKTILKIFLVINLILIGSLKMFSQISSQVINACLPSSTHSFQLSNPPNNPASICWDLGDGLGFVCNNSIRAQGIYSTPGVKNIVCKIETSPGVFVLYRTSISIRDKPNPMFFEDQPTASLVCSSSVSKTFQLLDTNWVSSVVWEVYSNSGVKISGTQSFSGSNFALNYNFTVSDTFRIKAIVFNRDNCVRDTSILFPIKLIPPIQGSFSSSGGPESCLPANYSFTPQIQFPAGRSAQAIVWTLTNLSVTPPSSQNFTTTNSQLSTFQLPTIHQPGNYQVSLVVVSLGCSSNISNPFDFTVDASPVLNFTVNGGKTPIQVCLDQSFELNNQTVIPSNSPGGSFIWDFYGLTRNSGAVKANYSPLYKGRKAGGNNIDLFSYTKISSLDSGINSVILRWTGACGVSDTLKNIVITKGPLAKIKIIQPLLPIDCDTPFSFLLSDSTSWKPNGFTYTHRWFRYDSLFNLIDSVEGTPKSTFSDTIRWLSERRFYQLKIISSDGCEATSIKIRIETRKPKAEFAPFPWFAHQTLDTLSCDSMYLPLPSAFPLAFQAYNSFVGYPYYSIIPNPETPYFYYNVKLFSPIWPASNDPCLSIKDTTWEKMRPIHCFWIGPNIVRQIVGLDSKFSKCSDTIEKTFFVKNFRINWGRIMNGTVLPNPSGICLGPNGAPVQQTFHIYEDTLYRWPAYNKPFEYIWTLMGPNTSQIVTTNSPWVNFNFSSPGIYQIYVQVKSNGNCTRELRSQVQVGEIASISPAPNKGDTLVICANTDVTQIIGNGSLGQRLSFRWEVFRATPSGKGLQINPLLAGSPVTMNSDTSSNPIFHFSNLQPVYLVVYVTNEFGCVDSAQLIVQGSRITAVIRPDTLMACPGYQMFRSLNQDAVSYRWEFTDPIGNQGNPLVTILTNAAPMDSVLGFFGIGGMKTVKLTVSSMYGCVDDTMMNVQVGGPIPSITVVSPTSKKGCDSLQVILLDRSQNIDRYVFSWGDGSSDYWLGRSNTHVYSYPYTLRTDSAVSFIFQLLAIGQSCIIPYRDTITVFPRPKVGGVVLSDSLCSPATFSILDTSKFSPNGNYGTGSSNTIFSWNFNDGMGWTSQTAPLSNRTFRRTIASPGNYGINLAIVNPWGCVDTGILQAVKVLDTPIANFYAIDSIKCWSNGNNQFVFRDASMYHNANPVQRKWYWSDPTAVPHAQNGWVSNGNVAGPINFTVPGANSNTQHSITLVVTNSLGCTDSITKPNYITVRDTMPPSPMSPTYVTVDPLSLRNHVEVNWTPRNIPEFSHYEIFRNNQWISNILFMNTSYFIDSLDVISAAATQQYKIRLTDGCGRTSHFDSTHSTIFLQVTTKTSNSFATNFLHFNAYQGWGNQNTIQSYEIFRKNGNLGLFQKIGDVVPNNDSSIYQYADSGLCSNIYYYYVKALHKNYFNASVGYYSISNYDSIVANFNVIRAPVEINYVTVDAADQISMQWTPAPLATGVLKNYFLERIDSNFSTPVLIYHGTQTFFSDVKIDATSKVYKYVVRYEDQCGNLSNSSDTSVNILAVASAVKMANYEAYDMKIDWTPYSTWKSGIIRYDIEVKYPNGWRNIGSVPGNTYSFLDVNVPRNEIEGAYLYRIKAIENEVNYDSSFSNIAPIVYPSEIIVPSAFSPNNDGTNDVHFVHGVAIKTIDFLVYNRWGECVFQSNNLQNGWNGKMKNTGEPCQPGLYVYVLNAKGKDQKKHFRKGTITLLK